MRPALSLAGAAIAVVMLVSGCVQGGTDVVSPPAANADPVFASDEEALAAATEAYKAYLAMSDLIGHEGGAGLQRLESVATREALAASQDEFVEFARQQLTSSGETRFAKMELQNYSVGASEDVVTVYACLDVSEVDVRDASGSSVVKDSRSDVQLMEVSFDLKATTSLIVSRIDPWDFEGRC